VARQQPVDLFLPGQVGADQQDVAERLCALAPPVVVRDHLGALRCEGAYAGAPDPARGAGDEDALTCKAGVDVWDSVRPWSGSG
jgi:hypothetical protein